MKKSLILLSFLFLMGCSEIRTVTMTPKNVKKLIKEKESSKRDVQELFGEPNKMSKNADGNDLWEYKRIVNGNTERTFMIIFDDNAKVDKFIIY